MKNLGEDLKTIARHIRNLLNRVGQLEQVLAPLLRKRPPFGISQVAALNGINNQDYTVYVTSSIPAAVESLSQGRRKIMPQLVTVYLAEAHPDADGGIAKSSTSIIVESRWKKPVTVSSGKAKIAEVRNGRLTEIDCEEVTP